MRVLMIGPDTSAKGGIATVIANFKAYFASDEHSIQYFTTWQEGSFFKRLQATTRAFVQIKKKIREEKIDIAHIHMAQQGSFYRKSVLLLLVKKNCRVVLHIHASQFDTFYSKNSFLAQRYIRWILNKPNQVVALSEEWATFYKQLTKVPVTVIENAVKMPVNSSYNSQAKNIVAFGRLGERKGSYDILKIAKNIENKFPNVRFCLYGDGDTAEIAAQIKEKTIGNVVLGGWVKDAQKEKIMQDAVLHALPSYHEGLPMAILETMSYGIPNISTNVGGIPQVIKDNENGLLIEAGDTEQLESKIIGFLANESQREKLSNAARETIKNRFAIEAYQKKWEQLYENMEK
ncbi:glycosytransferase [Listeria weihenstephanensis FSL R9-0317]|uniref:Glycosyl transferase n=1 Tax=Listeria weihenstephanensis TaxID=1006155 RepID=A0A1S7FQR6_9LIST|nr:glycosyltransferase family 4 protein [Listeria weihenstephanensis]AQY49737.1 glycosyl transferase [Listeria weihenstephanensis]EUJ41029.1 glycosytransferase [Listeria weihenstephanensis FSL R9-0317]